MGLPSRLFWQGRRVLVTGHTGFKGSWLTAWLLRLGARVTGFALPPATNPAAFTLLGLQGKIDSRFGDVRDHEAIADVLARVQPEIVFHLAAQPLVVPGYREPRETFETNVLGTVNLLEAARRVDALAAIVVVTTDKGYAERNDGEAYREDDRLGGRDPYAASKACAELVAACYRDAYLRERGVALATVRAGNVIGGGDWSAHRLIPDLVSSLVRGEPLELRNPGATRPWQHVLDPLAAYLLLAERLVANADLARAWNVGPDPDCAATVAEVVARFERAWDGAAEHREVTAHYHEAPQLILDASAARRELGWSPRLDLDAAIHYTAGWYRAHAGGQPVEIITEQQIARYEAALPLPALASAV